MLRLGAAFGFVNRNNKRPEDSNRSLARAFVGVTPQSHSFIRLRESGVVKSVWCVPALWNRLMAVSSPGLCIFLGWNCSFKRK